jgi:hypothetical protein
MQQGWGCGVCRAAAAVGGGAQAAAAGQVGTCWALLRLLWARMIIAQWHEISAVAKLLLLLQPALIVQPAEC